MSKTAAELLREMDAKATKGPWREHVYGGVYAERRDERGRRMSRREPDVIALERPSCPSDGYSLALGEGDRALIVALRNALPLLAAVLDAADAMRDWTPVSYVPGLLPEPIEALRVEACATYDAARAALAEALKEGR